MVVSRYGGATVATDLYPTSLKGGVVEEYRVFSSGRMAGLRERIRFDELVSSGDV